MTVHTIMLPDLWADREPRSIIWDDVEGTVKGEHSKVEKIREYLARPMPLELPTELGMRILEDPAHNPADFLGLLVHLDWRTIEPEIVKTFPPALRDIEPTMIKLRDDLVFDENGVLLGVAFYDDDGNLVDIGLH